MGGPGEVEPLPIPNDGAPLAQALAESEARFRLAFDAVTDSLVLFRPVFDADGAFLDAEISWMNRAARVRWFGAASLEDMQGVNIFEQAPMFRAPVFEIFQGVARGAGEFQGVISMDHPREGRVFLDLHITPFEGGFVYTSRDVTLSREAELSLRASEARFRLLAENASDVVFTASNEGVCTWISPSLTALVGWVPDQMVGHPFVDFVHPDDLGTLGAGRSEVMQGSAARYELRVRTADGGLRWVSITLRPVFDDAGTVVGRVGGWRDAQPEMEAREALAASQARLRATIDTMLDPLLMLQPVRITGGRIVDFVYADANDAAAAFAGRDRSDLPGLRIADLLPGLVDPEIIEMCARTMETGEPMVLNDYAPGDEEIDPRTCYDIRAVRVGDDLSFAWHDVTAHHLAQRALRRRVRQLDALRRISQLLAESRDPREVLDGVALEISILLAARCVRIHVIQDGNDATGQQRITSGSTGCKDFIDPESDLIHAASAGGKPVTTRPAGHVAHHHLAVPMVAGSRSVGTLIVGREDAAFSKDEIAVAGTAADLLAAAVQNAQLHDVEKQQAASGERQRLARDLHDAVTQSIYSASLISAALPDMWERSPEEGMKNLQALRRLVRAALAELRSLLYELRPASLEAAPLDVLLERLADSLKGRSEARLEIRVPSDLLLPPEVKLAFYRVAQEAINNVGKHSRSTVANVTVDTGDNGLRLVVSDDGWGFDPARRRRVTDASGDAFGIGIMQSRAEEIGATLEIDSIPGLGTTVEMIWHQPDAEDASQQWGDGPHG